MKETSNANEIFTHELRLLMYPKYQPGCSPEILLQAYQKMFQFLEQFDRSSVQNFFPSIKIDPKLKEEEEEEEKQIEKLSMELISVLNKICTFTHRKQLREEILKRIVKYTGRLKNIAVGRRPFTISHWEEELDVGNFVDLVKNIEQNNLEVLDELYLQFHMIPNLEILFMAHPAIFEAKFKFEKVLHNLELSIPLDHQYYLAIIASSTYGNRYIWNSAVFDFLKAGGDESWIREGVNIAPLYLQKLSRISSLMAYNFQQFQFINIFEAFRSEQSIKIEDRYLLEALFILCYYQALSCLCKTFGLVSKRKTQYEGLMPKFSFLKPSFQSFETLKNKEVFQQFEEQKKAEFFSKMFNLEKTQEQLISSEIKSPRKIMFKRIKSISKFVEDEDNTTDNQKQLQFEDIDVELDMGEALQFDKREDNFQQERTFKKLKKVYEKFVHFEKSTSIVFSELKSKSSSDKLSKSALSSMPSLEHHESQKSDNQNQFLYASDWNFDDRSCKIIDSVLGSKFTQALKGFISSMRSLNKEKSKNLKVYYQYLNNYMYQYISYVKLLKECLTTSQKNYIKLVTKSPFLFNEKSYSKMKEDLKKIEINAREFVCEAASYKLEMNINLITYLYDKFKESEEIE